MTFLMLPARAEGRLNFLLHEALDAADILYVTFCRRHSVGDKVLCGEYNYQQNRHGYRLNISCLIPCYIVDHSDRVF